MTMHPDDHVPPLSSPRPLASPSPVLERERAGVRALHGLPPRPHIPLRPAPGPVPRATWRQALANAVRGRRPLLLVACLCTGIAGTLGAAAWAAFQHALPAGMWPALASAFLPGALAFLALCFAVAAFEEAWQP